MPIKGATLETYAPGGLDVGGTLRLQVPKQTKKPRGPENETPLSELRVFDGSKRTADGRIVAVLTSQ